MMPNYARYDDLDEFTRFYRVEIAPALRADPDVDPERSIPTYALTKEQLLGVRQAPPL